MVDQNDDFFLEDQEAIEAADRLRASLGTSSPAEIISSGASTRRFRIAHRQLKDAVLVATLKGKIKEADELHFAVGDNAIELFAQFKGVEIWVVARKERSQIGVEKPLNFNLTHGITHRLASIKGIDTLDAQILLGGAGDDANELRVKLGSTRVRLPVAQARLIPVERDAIGGGTGVRFDPSALKLALRDNLEILAVSACKDIIRAENAQVYACSPKAVIVSTHPSFAGIEFQIAADDARVLARVVGRMRNGPAAFFRYESHYVFRDDLILCRVRRTQSVKRPIANILAAEAERTFVPATLQAIKLGWLAATMSAARVSLEWPDRSTSSNDSAVKIAFRAYTPGRLANGQSSLDVWANPESTWSAGKITLDARLWIAAMQLFDLDARMQWWTLKSGRILRLTGVKDDAQTIVFIAK